MKIIISNIKNDKNKVVYDLKLNGSQMLALDRFLGDNKVFFEHITNNDVFLRVHAKDDDCVIKVSTFIVETFIFPLQEVKPKNDYSAAIKYFGVLAVAGIIGIIVLSNI